MSSPPPESPRKRPRPLPAEEEGPLGPPPPVSPETEFQNLTDNWVADMAFTTSLIRCQVEKLVAPETLKLSQSQVIEHLNALLTELSQKLNINIQQTPASAAHNIPFLMDAADIPHPEDVTLNILSKWAISPQGPLG